MYPAVWGRCRGCVCGVLTDDPSLLPRWRADIGRVGRVSGCRVLESGRNPGCPETGRDPGCAVFGREDDLLVDKG